MKKFNTEAMDKTCISEVLDHLETEAEYMENVQDEPEYASGMFYVINILREWHVRKTFMEVNLSRRDAEFRRDVG